jgi:hypothetical protein
MGSVKGQTPQTPPENLRKFLESDDPAIILMGASLLKGVVKK